MNTRKRKLTDQQRSAIYLMCKRGDRIQDIAYWFGVSPATVHKIKQGTGDVRRYQNVELPQPGPYQLVAKEGLAVIERKASLYDRAEAERLAAEFVVQELSRLLEEYKLKRVPAATCGT